MIGTAISARVERRKPRSSAFHPCMLLYAIFHESPVLADDPVAPRNATGP
jgi:hypothetical protein